jgi:flagellar protein FlgJ
MNIPSTPMMTPLADPAGGLFVAGPGQEAESLGRKLLRAAETQAVDEAELRKAAKEFDGYFVSYLMKVMRETVPKGFLPNKGGEQFYYFYDQEIGRLAAERGGLGFGKMVLEQYLAQQRRETPKNLSSSGSSQPIPESSR